MSLIGMNNVTWGFGDPPLLEEISFQIAPGERICLLGRNGVGKSSLLKLLAGRIQPDNGEVWCRQGVTVACLDQEVPPEYGGTLFEVVARGLGDTGVALAEYHQFSRKRAEHSDDQARQRSEILQKRLNELDGWRLQKSVETALSLAELNPDTTFADLSAGMKRRVLFARALAKGPDLLLLDEPTNHLDIEAITWLEDAISRNVNTVLFVSHDRAFTRRLATRIMELDRGRLHVYNCDYSQYLKRRQADLETEQRHDRQFDKKLSQEERWIRQGIKARRTRNEGRVRALMKLREQARMRRSRTGNVRMQLQEAERTGKLVIQAEGLTHQYDNRTIVKDFSTTIMRGDKVGIIGPNGAGKTTLINLLIGQIAPQAGTVRLGTRVQTAYYDQLRFQLDEQKTVARNISDGNDFIVFNGEKRHVISHLQDFLFSPERCRTPVHVLSGGERNRLMLAKLFTQPANVLILDEPTNDLDAETLELLEELLLSFDGTLLLVSHDRTFLNNVVTSTLVFEGQGHIVEYAGGYDDWLKQRAGAPKAKEAQAEIDRPKIVNRSKAARPKKRTYAEDLELKALPEKIESLENMQQDLQATMADPTFFKKTKEEIVQCRNRLAEVEAAIEDAYRRWERLENVGDERPASTSA